MVDWTLVPSLVSLKAEFTALAPDRDKTSDGSIGDTAHAQSSSDHNPDETGATPTEDADNTNEVHAIDVDRDLNQAGVTMERCVQTIVTRHREGHDDRLQNVIFDRRIWSRSWGWTAHEYTGSNPHDHHAHFSARYGTAQENDTRPWGLLSLREDDMELNTKIGDPNYAGRDVGDVLRDLVHLRGWLIGEPKDSKVTPPVPGSPLAQMLTVAKDSQAALNAVRLAVTQLNSTAARLLQLADAEAREVPPTPDQVAAAVLAQLPQGSDPVSREELTEALGSVFRQAFTG